MAVSTLSSSHHSGQYIPMTMAGINCPAPILEDDIDSCQVPGGSQFWKDGGFYSPGVCFIGYEALCTQTSVASSEWPIEDGETVVMCIPADYGCQSETEDQRYATTDFGGTVLSVPAFEIRWRSKDLQSGTANLPPPGVQSLPPSTTYQSPADSQTGPEAPISSTLIDSLSTLIHTGADRPPETQPPASLNTASMPPTSHSLSAAAIGGISVGSVIGLLAVLIPGIILRKKQINAKSKNRPVEVDGETTRQSRTAELESKPMPPRELPAEPQISPLSEVSQFHGDVAQASINITPVELASQPMHPSSPSSR